MFYEEKNEKELREALFKNPGSSYRGAPFWAWNTRLDKNELISRSTSLKKWDLEDFIFTVGLVWIQSIWVKSFLNV